MVPPISRPTALPPTPVSTPEASESIEGLWEGVITTFGGNELEITIDFRTGIQGLEATIDIPQQGRSGVVLSNVSFEPPTVHFEIEEVDGVFQGVLEDALITGTYQQSGIEASFDLTRQEGAVLVAVTEEPPPYDQEEVVFQNEDVTLAGTLTLPPSSGPHPAVVLISGSGPQNRDEEILGFKIFGIIADHLTRRGIAVLRYDDRGVGGSTGDVFQATLEDFATDVLAAIELLRNHQDINPDQIGLLGHSEGGYIALLVASRSDHVAFNVLVAAPGLTGEELLRAQLESILRAGGATEEEIQQARQVQNRTLEVVRTGEGWEELEAESRQRVLDSLDGLPENERAAILDVDQFVTSVVEPQLKAAQSPWYKSVVEYDPRPDLQKLTAPVLAVFGELDVQVPAEMNERAIRQALEAAGNEDITSVIFPQTNHLFQVEETGSLDESVTESVTLKKEFVPGFLDLITEWILDRVDFPEP